MAQYSKADPVLILDFFKVEAVEEWKQREGGAVVLEKKPGIGRLFRFRAAEGPPPEGYEMKTLTFYVPTSRTRECFHIETCPKEAAPGTNRCEEHALDES